MKERDTPPEVADQGAPLVARPALRSGFLSLRTLLSFAIAAALLVLVWFLNDLSVEEILDRLSRANPWLIVAAFVVYGMNFPMRTLRWRILLNNAVKHEETTPKYTMWGLFQILYISWFVNGVIPLKMGDVYRAYMARANYGTSLTRTLGTVFTERVLDVVTLIVIVLASSVFVLQMPEVGEDVGRIIMVAVIVLAVLAAAVFAMLLFGSPIFRRFPKRVAEIYERFHSGVFDSWTWRSGPYALAAELRHLDGGDGPADPGDAGGWARAGAGHDLLQRRGRVAVAGVSDAGRPGRRGWRAHRPAAGRGRRRRRSGRSGGDYRSLHLLLVRHGVRRGDVCVDANEAVGRRVRVGIDYTSAATQREGIGRATRELVGAMLRLPDCPELHLVYAHRGPVPEADALAVNERVRVRRLPLSPRVMLAGWYKARLPLPIEALLGPLHVMHGPDFVLPPRLAAAGVVTVHDLAFATRPEDAHPAQRRFLESAVPWSIDRARLVVAVSETTRRDLMTRYGVRPHRIRVVPNAVSSEFHERDGDGGAGRGATTAAAARGIPAERGHDSSTEESWGAGPRRRAERAATGAGAAGGARGTRRLAVRAGVCRRRVGRTARHSLRRPNQRRDAARALSPGGRAGVSELCGGLWPSHPGGIRLRRPGGDVRTDPGCSRRREMRRSWRTRRIPDSIAAGIVRVVRDADRRAELLERGRRRLEDFSWSRSARRMLDVYAEARRGEPSPQVSGDAAKR